MSDVGGTIAAVLALDPAADAIEFEGRWSGWGALAARIAALGALYDRIGLGPGARIGVMLRNRPPQLAALFSTIVGGRCLVTLNPLYPDALLAEDIAKLGLPVVLGDRRDLARGAVAEAARASGAALIALPEGDDEAPAIVTAGSGGDPARRIAADVIIEMLTSGTTGRPKRVALTRAAFQYSFDAALGYEAGRDAAPKLRSGVQLLSAPLTHIGGVWGAVNAIAAGRRLVLLEKFTVAAWRDAVARHRPLAAGVTAAGLRMILDADVPREDLASLKVLSAGAAPTDPAIIDAFRTRYGIPVLANYGATEFAGPVAGWSLADHRAQGAAKRGSVGRLHAGVEARIVDPLTGTALAHGETGVLELRSPQLVDPQHWLRTTDLAALDADGFLWIHGRADGAIIRGGFKVQPEDVVRALEAHPAVREAAVVALPDERLGQVPAAAVIARSGVTPPTAEALLAHLRARLLPYQLPVLIAIVDDLPRTASTKPILPEVAALLAARRDEETAA